MYTLSRASRVVPVVKNLPANAEDVRDAGLIPGWEDSLEKGMATHYNILAWRIPMDRGAQQATVHGATKSQTRLKQLSTHTHVPHLRPWPQIKAVIVTQPKLVWNGPNTLQSNVDFSIANFCKYTPSYPNPTLMTPRMRNAVLCKEKK